MYFPPSSPATEAMFTTRPQWRSTIPGRKAWVHRNVPVAFTVRMRFQSARVVRCKGAEWLTPALFTRMSTWPRWTSAARASACTLAGSVTSHDTAQAPRAPVTTAPVQRASRAELREHRLLEDRTEGLDGARTLGGPGGGWRAEVRAWPARRFEARLPGPYRHAERARVGG